MRYPAGQPVRISTTVRNLDGVLVNPDSITLAVKLRQADGTWLATGTYGSPVNDGAGEYHQDVPAADLAANGHYQYAWTSAGTAAGVSYGDFDVFDPFEIRVISLQDAKGMLSIPQATTTYDAEILEWTGAIESGLERFTGGPVVNRAVTERSEMQALQTVIPVRQRPLVSVTSITSASGGAIDISGLDLDVNAGLIRRPLGLPFYGPFFQWLPQVTVVYVAGWGTSVPAAFAGFARIVIQHLWSNQRGPVAMPMGGTGVVTPPWLGFAIPNAALELLNGSQDGVPFAVEAYV